MVPLGVEICRASHSMRPKHRDAWSYPLCSDPVWKLLAARRSLFLGMLCRTLVRCSSVQPARVFPFSGAYNFLCRLVHAKRHNEPKPAGPIAVYRSFSNRFIALFLSACSCMEQLCCQLL